MKVLVLCKRRYTGKDLLNDQYGRLYELPVGMAKLGAKVSVVATSYASAGRLSESAFGVEWRGLPGPVSPFAVWRAWQQEAARFRPDVILAASDAIHLHGGVRLARSIGVPVVVDLYDDFEAFGLTWLPTVRTLLRKACREADAITVVSKTLAATLMARVSLHRTPVRVPNGVADEPEWSFPVRRAREILGLPLDVPIVGTVGAVHSSRGVDDLFRAFELVRRLRPEAVLAIAGPRDRVSQRSISAQAIDLGILPHRDARLLIRALDVGVVCNRDSLFGRACHPQKLVEMIRARTPVVATAVGEVSQVLKGWPELAYEPGDSAGLADRIVAQLDEPVRLPLSLASSWLELAAQMLGVLESVKCIVPGEGAAAR